MFAWRPFESLSARELHDLLKLRADVFVVEQACAFAEIDGRDPEARHLLARRVDGGPLDGTLRLFPPDAGTGHAAIGRVAAASAVRGTVQALGPVDGRRRVAAASAVRGTGFGRALMAEGMAEARRLFGPAPIAIGAQSRLERFYAGLGFVRTGEDYIEDGMPHCAMVAR